jgi:two-component system, LytTR family, sensor kinase
MQKPNNQIAAAYGGRLFWSCNLAAWLLITLAQSFIDSFDRPPMGDNILHHLPGSLLGMAASFGVHRLHRARQWHQRHPVRLIPLACLLSLIFAATSTVIHEFDLLLQTPEICSRTLEKAPDFYCGHLTNRFTNSLFAMLVVTLFYVIIQAERKSQSHMVCNRRDQWVAFIALVALIKLHNLLSALAWGSDASYLFSEVFFLSEASTFFVMLVGAFYGWVMLPGSPIFQSRLLPLLPRLLAITCCSAVLAMGASAAFWNTYYFLKNADAQFFSMMPQILLGYSYGNFNSRGQLGGWLQGYVTHILLLQAFFIACRFSKVWQKTAPTHGKHLPWASSLIFYTYNLGYWLCFGLLIYASGILMQPEIGESTPLISTLAFTLFGLVMGAELRSQIEQLIARKAAVLAIVIKIFFAALLAGSLVTSIIWFSCYAYIFVALDGYQLNNFVGFVNDGRYVMACFLTPIVLCGLWSFICYTIIAQSAQRDAAIKQLQLEKNIKDVQLNSLAGKVDPHFVFNALSNIRSLIDEDTEKARSAIVALSDILRSPITNNAQDKITLADELQNVGNYIALCKIQFEERLHYVEQIDPGVSQAQIPSMMLQILVENAIKHGISQLPDGGTLWLRVTQQGQQFICRLVNDGPLAPDSETCGLGLGTHIIKERISLLYQENASFQLYAQNHQVVAELILPIE